MLVGIDQHCELHKPSSLYTLVKAYSSRPYVIRIYWNFISGVMMILYFYWILE